MVAVSACAPSRYVFAPVPQVVAGCDRVRLGNVNKASECYSNCVKPEMNKSRGDKWPHGREIWTVQLAHGNARVREYAALLLVRAVGLRPGDTDRLASVAEPKGQLEHFVVMQRRRR
ncbi:MAG: hypothetical protein JWM53_4712 [bacterium]|nr:hypothetical protein [bacterium]